LSGADAGDLKIGAASPWLRRRYSTQQVRLLPNGRGYDLQLIITVILLNRISTNLLALVCLNVYILYLHWNGSTYRSHIPYINNILYNNKNKINMILLSEIRLFRLRLEKIKSINGALDCLMGDFDL